MYGTNLDGKRPRQDTENRPIMNHNGLSTTPFKCPGLATIHPCSS